MPDNSISNIMHAVVITTSGEPEVLQWVERPMPKPKADEVLISVKAAGVNRPDIFQRQGGYPAPAGVPQDIPGLEVAGEILALGDEVSRWKVGDRVCALLAGGGYATHAVAPAAQCLRIPSPLSFEEAASFPETFFTVWSNVFDRAGLVAGQRLLVHGGTSGIGVAAIQMAVAMGCEVYTTAGTAEKCNFCLGLGAKLAINYKEQDFESTIKAATQESGIHVVLDMIGGDYTQKNLNLLAVEGCLVIINAMKDRYATVDLKRLMLKRLKITGSTLRSREVPFKAAIAEQLERHIWPHLHSGKIKAEIDSIFPMHEAFKAHKRMESGAHIGKIVLVNED